MFPALEPYDSGMLDVGDGHQVYWEASGNPDGIPALYLHGGPGGVLRGGYRRNFDPTVYRIISLQQRGAGLSTPSAAQTPPGLAHLTTAHLIADIEALREHLDVGQWLVCGASWGSTLALQYALAHREAVLGLVLVSVTTTSPSEVRWISEGAQVMYPEAWAELAGVVEELEPGFVRGSSTPLIDAVARVMARDDHAARLRMADAWCAWEDTHVGIGTPADQRGHHGFSGQDEQFRLAITTLVATTWARHRALDPAWVPAGGVMAHLDELEGLPLCMVHGRRDVSGPVVTPWRIKQSLPEAKLLVVEQEGHGGVRMSELWCRATQAFADTGSFDGTELLQEEL